MNAKIEVRQLNLWYAKFQALHDIHLTIREKAITALIGPSGCGKSTLLRCINRMNDLIEEVRIEGTVKIEDEDIYQMRFERAPEESRDGLSKAQSVSPERL
jgi:phosphate transport system ATP-binding protein